MANHPPAPTHPAQKEGFNKALLRETNGQWSPSIRPCCGRTDPWGLGNGNLLRTPKTYINTYTHNDNWQLWSKWSSQGKRTWQQRYGNHVNIMQSPWNSEKKRCTNVESEVPNIKMPPAPVNAELDLWMPPPFIEAIKFRERFLHWLTWEWIGTSTQKVACSEALKNVKTN